MNDKYDEPMLRYNDQKVVSWLRRKVEAVRLHLAASNASPSSPAEVESQFAEPSHSQFGSCPTVTTTAAPTAADENLVSALAWVAEYLPPALQRVLCDAFGTSEEAVVKYRGKPKKTAAAQAPSNEVASWKQELAAEQEIERELAAQKVERIEAPAAKKQKVLTAPLQCIPSRALRIQWWRWMPG